MTALSQGPLTDEQRADLRIVPLPGALIIQGVDRRPDFERFVRELVVKLAASGEISDPKTGFGFATTGVVSIQALLDANLEDPLSYIASAFVDGELPVRYAWNAVRKIYELLRLLQEGQLEQAGHTIGSTLEAVMLKIMRPAVDSENADHTVGWGPFSHGGAVICRSGDRVVITALSVWKAAEDHRVALDAAAWQLDAEGSDTV